MIRSHRKIALLPAIAVLIASLSPYTLKSAETPVTTTGETVDGLNKSRLERLHDGLRRFVDSGEYAGTISLLMRGGQVADVYVYGMQDIENKIPMGTDTICRMYSQSKIITTVSALILVEEGKLDLGDPVEKYLPQLSNRQVMIGGTPDDPKLVAASHAFTVRELMTHTAGLCPNPDSPILQRADAVSELWKRAN
jgi:CubicO group peptidase (beta-lactamase class C family)